MATWRGIRLLGDVVVDDGTTASSIGGPKPQLALALLAVNGADGVAAESLIECLWGDAVPSDPTASLQVLLSRLRRSIEPAGADIERAAGRYRLRTEPGGLDIDRLRQAAAAVETLLAGDDHAEVLRLTDEALALWRGLPFGSASSELALSSSTASLIDHRARLVEARATALGHVGRDGDAIELLVPHVDEHPYREQPVGLLAAALYRDGRQQEALTLLADARRRLVEDLGLDPTPELTRIEQAILEHSPLLASTPTQPSPIVAGTDRRVVGRADVLERLSGTRRAGRHALITGPAGIGKSTIVMRRSEAVVGRCVDLDGAPPLWPWPEVLAELRRKLVSVGAATEATDAALDAVDRRETSVFTRSIAIVRALTEAKGAVPTIVIEDLHWADAAARQLAHFAVTQLRDGPSILVTSREPHDDLLAVGSVDHIELEPLDRADVARLLQLELRLPPPDRLTDQVMAESLGNPLLVSRALESLAEPGDVVVASRRELAKNWLDGLDEADLALFETAAVLGERFTIGDLARTTTRSANDVLDALVRAGRAGLVRLTGTESAAFVHALARVALIDRLDAGRRIELHHRIAQVLQADADPTRSAELAGHLGAAGPLVDPGLVLTAATDAMRAASAAGDHAQAVVFAVTAAEAADRHELDDDARVDLALDLGATHWLAGDVATARATFASAAAVVGDDDPRLLRLAADYAGFGMASVELDTTGAELLDRALASTAAAQTEHAEVVLRCRTRQTIGTFDEATIGVAAAQLETEARSLGDPVALTWALGAVLVGSMTMAGVDTRLARSLDMIALGEEIGSDAAIGLGLVHRADSLAESGDIGGAAEIVARLEQLAQATGRSAHVWYHRQYLGALTISQGRFDEGEALIGEALGAGQETHLAPAMQAYAGALSASKVAQGRAGELLALADAVGDPEGFETLGFNAWELGLSICAADAGDLDQARERLGRALADAPRVRADRIRSLELAQLIDSGVRVGDRQAVALGRQLLTPHAGRCCAAPSLILAGAADAWLGLADSFLGNDDGDALLRHGIETNRRWGLHAWADRLSEHRERIAAR